MTNSSVIKRIKEELCYVSSKTNQNDLTDKPYTLPDKSVINLSGTLRTSIPELMFSSASIHKLAW